MDYILLIVGFILLIKGADIFVDAASKIAKRIGIPSIIVGLTIVSLGTSAPELAVSLISAINGTSDIAIGNVLGSNLFNSLMVLGGTAVVVPLLFKKATVKRDYIVNFVVTVILFILAFGITLNDNYLSRIDGIILLILCVAYITYLVYVVKKSNNLDETEEEKESRKEVNVVKNIILAIIGVVGIVFGGDLVVDSATNIATSLGMSSKLVGLTIVAMGTSLPELVTSIVAALKGENDIALGNVLGCNIFNILLILGTSSAICPFAVDPVLAVDFIILIGITILIGVLIFANKKKEKNFTRVEGLLLVAIYIFYLIYVIMRN